MNALPPTRQAGHQEAFVTVDLSVENAAYERTIIGDFFEEVTATLTGAKRFHTVSGKVCPDLVCPRGFLECKSLGHRRQPILFKESLDNYSALTEEGASITFIFWLHSYNLTFPTSKSAVRGGLAVAIDGVLLVPFTHIREIVASLKIYSIEYSNDRRKEAYRPAFGLFARRYMHGQQETLCAGGELRDGIKLPAFPIHGANHGIFHV